MRVQTQKLNIQMATTVKQRIDTYAEQHGISRSAAISMLCIAQLDAYRAMDVMPEMTATLKEVQTRLDNMESKT